MQLSPKTITLLAFRALGYPYDGRWADWAAEMLMVGHDSPNLRILAAFVPPYNQFELHALTQRVLDEIGLAQVGKDEAIGKYVSMIIQNALDGKIGNMHVLHVLKKMIEHDGLGSEYDEFSSLYWAKEELSYSDELNWRPGATRENIDEIIQQYFEAWLEKYPIS